MASFAEISPCGTDGTAQRVIVRKNCEELVIVSWLNQQSITMALD